MQLAPNNGIRPNINTAALGMSCILCPGFHSPCYFAVKYALKQQLLHKHEHNVTIRKYPYAREGKKSLVENTGQRYTQNPVVCLVNWITGKGTQSRVEKELYCKFHFGHP